MTSRRVRPVAAAAACVLIVAGCSDSAGSLDEAATERAVGRAVAAEVAPTVTGTDCGEDLEQVEGGTFTCTVTLKGVGPLAVDVRQVDDEGTLDVAPAAAVVTVERITDELTTSLEKQFKRTFQVRCSGDPIEVRAPASTSTCSAKDATSRRQVTVTVTDTAGTLAFAVAPPR
ncbi:MAG: hypothetical protein JWO77_3641 [Ilumatobacteraceae bacterium]|nr:hypothetical protein [Ilumatobacteraceae bacterium]